MIYGCSLPRELWFIDFNHVTAVEFRKRHNVYTSICTKPHSLEKLKKLNQKDVNCKVTAHSTTAIEIQI